MNREKITAVVPSRKGSQRVKNKNFKPFAGKNLLELKLEILKNISLIDDIVVNTDSQTAISIAKRSFNADTDHINGIGALGMESLRLYYDTEESKEGGNAFREKRKPDFRKYVK